MKNLIFQCIVLNDDVDKTRGKIGDRKRSDLYKEMAAISSQSFQIYAEKVNADYKFSTEQFVSLGHEDYRTFFFEVLRTIYDESFDDYDKVLFVDADVIANTNQNIFDLHTGDVSGVLESDILTELGGSYSTWDSRESSFIQILNKFESFGCPPLPVFEPNVPSRLTVLNSGVLVWSREARIAAREVFDDWKDWLYYDEEEPLWLKLDQFFVSCQLVKNDFELNFLPQTWNDTPCHYNDVMTGMKSNFLHYTGGDYKLELVNHYNRKLFKLFEE